MNIFVKDIIEFVSNFNPFFNVGVFYLSAPPKELSTLPNLNKCTTSCFQNTTPLFKIVQNSEKKFLENFSEIPIFVLCKR